MAKTKFKVLFAGAAFALFAGGASPALAACATISGNNPDAPLTGNFAANPGQTTCNARNLNFAQTYAGGEQFRNFLRDWWNNEMLPAMRNMTSELTAVAADQTRNFAATVDATNRIKTQQIIQKNEIDSTLDYMPSEYACTSASFTASMTQAQHTSAAISRALKNDLRNELNAAAGTPGAGGKAASHRARWLEYCQYFHDPQKYGGVSSCPNPNTPGTIMDGDINIESLLFADTIDLDNPNQRRAAVVMLRNLIAPRPFPLVDPSQIEQSELGREIILKQQQLLSVRNIAAEVVASIISRRAAINYDTGGANAPTPGPLIRDIRLKAGIPENEISPRPSYNEIMQAMTKERFMDPKYFANMADEKGAVRQEQTMLDAYTVLMLEDIHELQEKINAVMAARAALKLNRVPTSHYRENMPSR